MIPHKQQPGINWKENEIEEPDAKIGITDIINSVIEPEETFAYTPFQVRKKKKRKPNRKT
jgi:hypothetical protein